jgi:pimeloyl-ACP methyl ester carboxylesterase
MSSPHFNALRSWTACLTTWLALGVPTAVLPTAAKAQDAGLQAVQASYQGTVDNKGGCNKAYEVKGWSLGGDVKRPLFLYFIGTNFGGEPLNQGFLDKTPQAVAQAMALRGFVAVAVQYDNSVSVWLSGLSHKDGETKRCLFDAQATGGLVNQLCEKQAIAGVDCGLGIATWGHSLGGAMAVAAANTEPRVRAAWATGINGIVQAGGAAPALSKRRIRIVNGNADAFPLISWLVPNNNDGVRLTKQLGLTHWLDCPFQRNQCIRHDGSGWMLVQGGPHGELSTARQADHCWFDRVSCLGGMLDETNFLTGHSRISIHANADWVARTVRQALP